jgi:Tol biopolymer transport system component
MKRPVFGRDEPGSKLTCRAALGSLTRILAPSFALAVVAGWPALSPDASSVAYAVESEPSGPWHIFVMGMNGRRPVPITSGPTSDVAPSFSPDGTQIVFARAAESRPYSMGGTTWDQWDVWISNTDGSQLRQLTNRRYRSVDAPCFSPDGKQILFAATPSALAEGAALNRLYVLGVPADNQPGIPKLLPLGRRADYDGQPSFSRDGLRIAFISRSGSRGGLFDYEVWTARADGAKCQQITHDQALDPDEKFIYYFADPARTGARQLRRIPGEGSGKPETLVK